MSHTPPESPHGRFLTLLRASVKDSTLVKLTLGKYRGSEAGMKNIFVRPVVLKAGPQLSFVFRYATRDVTKNFPPDEALKQIESRLGREFQDAHLFTPAQTTQLAVDGSGTARLHVKTASAAPQPATATHDRTKQRAITAESSWLHALEVTDAQGRPRGAMTGKFRQINRFVELMSHLTDEADLPTDRPFELVDMGCGKGYLTFAVAAFFGPRVHAIGVELRPELVDSVNKIAKAESFENLHFVAGSIANQPPGPMDVLVALHACDTATDDALAAGIAANAALIVVSPCCQKELRPQLTAPRVLTRALSHGIFQERQAEFVTDALRAQLLEWAGYRTKVFEFISTEHTAKNLMIAAIREKPRGQPAVLTQL
ncbi:MAG TPA: SAM-dependent methyltransferase, partial [Opitutaceae bacterium]